MIIAAVLPGVCAYRRVVLFLMRHQAPSRIHSRAYYFNHESPGGWVMFTARMFHSPVSWIAHECQMITVSVDYSRPPEHPFPKALQDVYYALLWTQVNAAKLGMF